MYYYTHREHILERTTAYYYEHKQKYNDYNRQYYEKNKARLKLKSAERYREKHEKPVLLTDEQRLENHRKAMRNYYKKTRVAKRERVVKKINDIALVLNDDKMIVLNLDL